MDLNELEAAFREFGFEEFRWIDPRTIVLAQWVRMKCIYGCGGYGDLSTCPPNVPSVSECERFVKEYTKCAVFHFEKRMDRPEERHGGLHIGAEGADATAGPAPSPSTC